MRKIGCLPIVVILSLLGCGDDGDSGSNGGSGTNGSAMTSFDDQVASGMALYADHCAGCHGDFGNGTDLGPPLAGDEALPLDPPESSMFRITRFRTALNVFEFVSESMPADNPGSLEVSEYIDILAFALFANGVSLDQPLDAEVAGTIELNP